MKLRNKRTGEIMEFDAILPVKDVSGDSVAHLEYNSLTEFNEEWEDAPEESKEYWFINSGRESVSYNEEDEEPEDTEACKEIGNYFETKEEAEKAVEKLKAWKRLKDKGFEFDGWTIDDGLKISIRTNFEGGNIYSESEKEIRSDLDLLFGGEE